MVRSQKIQGLYAIADNTFRSEFSPAELAKFYLEGGCRLIQLRMKGVLSTQYSVLSAARRMIELRNKYSFTFIINDDVDVALEVGADGVHVGKEDMPVSEIRKRVGNKMLIGYSSHSLEEALLAERAGADYVAFGAIFPTKTKGPGHPVQGLEKLREVAQAVKIPVVAIGGINKENFQNVLETGAAAIAMITTLTEAFNVVEATRFFTSYFAPSTKH